MRFEWKTEFVQRRKTYFLFLAKTRASWSTNFHHRKVMEGTPYWEKLKINFQVNITSRFTFQKKFSCLHRPSFVLIVARAKKILSFWVEEGTMGNRFPFRWVLGLLGAYKVGQWLISISNQMSKCPGGVSAKSYFYFFFSETKIETFSSRKKIRSIALQLQLSCDEIVRHFRFP